MSHWEVMIRVYWILFHLPCMVVFGIRLPTAEEVFQSIDEGIRIRYEDFQKKSMFFKSKDIVDFQPIAIDSRRQQIVVGARDVIIRLKADDLKALEQFDWPAERRAIEMCRMKGQSAEECHNFIRTLILDGGSILVCGTHAYSPSCTWRKVNDLKTRTKNDFSGIGVAPYSPEYNSTHVMTRDGQLYTGIVTDFAGHRSSILRILPSNRILRTARFNDRWLNEPEFVASFEFGNFVYFFFREPAVETDGCGLRTVSRIARMCKNDYGGDIILQDYWTTFTKSTLNCSANGVVYDHLESVFFVASRSLVYATFSTTPKSGILSSAICVYSITAFREAFGSSYLFQKGSHWVQHPNSLPYFDCEVNGVSSNRPGLTRRPLVDAQRYQIMADHVQPTGKRALHFTPLEKYNHMVVDTVRVKHYGPIQVVFILTESGMLKKFTVLPESVSKRSRIDNNFCLVEVVQVFKPDEQFSVRDMKLFHEMGAIYIGTKRSLLKIPVQRCERFSNRQQCVDSEDPYCGWNSKEQKCTVAPQKITSHHYWHQNLDGCPKTNFPVNGKYGEWSEWFSCPQDGGNNGENCLCKSRTCDNPKPRLGGKSCSGPKVQVTNCTRHGRFTDWSDWSGCSASCGVSMRTRKRDCSNPSPAYGGRICVGPTEQQEYCKQTACPIATEPPVHGGWSPWGPWDRCTRKCGGGFQRRIRLCNNPSPANHGSPCSGCDTEYRACHTEPCEEVRRWSDWTPWLQGNSSGSGNGILVQRFKFACRARIDDPKLVSVSRPRSQEKFCRKDGRDCTDTAFVSIDGGWSEWTSWSECSLPCGNGTQSRIRTCSDPVPSGSGMDCPGHAKEQRQCNTHTCLGSWTCWSDYGECSVSCGSGVQHRVRKCNTMPGMKPCEGSRVETTSCDMGPCTEDGYGIWSGWSSCSELGVKVRIRPCISKSYCSGIPDAQMKRCHSPESEASEYRSSSWEQDKIYLILGILGAFLVGIGVTLAITCYAVRKQSNCCYLYGQKKAASQPSAHPPTPAPIKSNIYTPPPTRNIHPVNTNITVNPLTNLLGPDKVMEFVEMDGLSEQEANLTLRRTMRASLNTRDYL